MKSTESGVLGTQKSVLFFPNGMGALILKTNETYEISPLVGNAENYEILENQSIVVDKGGLDSAISEISLSRPD